MILERRKIIKSWTDRAIQPGSNWDTTIDEHLRAADIVLLLISNDFIASDYIWGEELRIAMERHTRDEAVVVPIMVRPVDLQADDAADIPFVKLQGLPKDFKPVTTWTNADEAWTSVASGIRQTVNTINARRAAVAPQAPAAAPAPVPPPVAAPAAARPDSAIGLAPPDLHADRGRVRYDRDTARACACDVAIEQGVLRGFHGFRVVTRRRPASRRSGGRIRRADDAGNDRQRRCDA
ncbi:MAG: toll/interleukin-1 receptor domain-containing protein [Vicinamibacterales bacterium]